jgi:hypothetical protein
MYGITATSFGYEIAFGGVLDADAVQAWLDELRSLVRHGSDPFGVLVDMRTLEPLCHRSRTLLLDGQRHCRAAGMRRSAVVVNSAVRALQFRRMGMESGIIEGERYIDAAVHPNWRRIALDWLESGVEPAP